MFSTPYDPAIKGEGTLYKMNVGMLMVKSPYVVWEFVNPFVQLSRSRLCELYLR